MKTLSARLAAAYCSALAVAAGAVLLDLATAADAHEEPATVLAGVHRPPTEWGGADVRTLTVRTDGGGVLTAREAFGSPLHRAGDRVAVVRRAGAVGLVVRHRVASGSMVGSVGMRSD